MKISDKQNDKQYMKKNSQEKCLPILPRFSFKLYLKKGENTKGKLFLQDGDPRQNSKKARNALDKVGFRLFEIPAQSPHKTQYETFFIW